MSSPYILPAPLESILYDLQQSIKAGLYYPALLVALTIPEICITLGLDKNVFVKEKHYSAFIDKYTTPPTLGLSGVDCYRLRCGIVHRANLAGHPHFGATHVIFTVPNTGHSLHAFSINHGEKIASMFDLKTFCDAMDNAVRKWFKDNEKNATVISNLKDLISYRPFGAPPFFSGAPVVASGPES